MAGELELVFLGTGTSHGVPMIGCDCPVCRSRDPHDRRNRASVALCAPRGHIILIDTSPELRLSAIACGIRRVDAILFTHAHADHIMGLDDIRRFNDARGDAIPCYANAPTLQRLRQVFGYAEIDYAKVATYRPSVRYELMDGPKEMCGVRVQPLTLLHGQEEVLGFRVGALAYCTDCSAIPAGAWGMLEGLELLVLDALRHTPHPTHFNLAGALDVVARLRPAKTLLTHITHELPHAATNAALPSGVELAYDTQRVRVAI